MNEVSQLTQLVAGLTQRVVALEQRPMSSAEFRYRKRVKAKEERRRQRNRPASPFNALAYGAQ